MQENIGEKMTINPKEDEGEAGFSRRRPVGDGDGKTPDVKKEWIERLDNPELSVSEQFDLGMESDFNMNADHMMAYQEAEWCGDDPPTLEELKREEEEYDERNRDSS